jgi:hypothetical protein
MSRDSAVSPLSRSFFRFMSPQVSRGIDAEQERVVEPVELHVIRNSCNERGIKEI